ncbi:hypothetical protein PG985_016075 [Apiospora marii]|uniref:Rhodopsin domain-containing protein n=1 Tax=Apiospora marii TaxID=335849 RepID=A0ABR1S3R6_9PEZI
MDPNAPVLITEHAIHSEHVFYGVTIPLIVLSALTYGVRMARYRTRTSLWAEVCITLGFALTLADWGLLVATMQGTPGLKSHQAFVDQTKYGFLAIPIWGLSMAFIKSSIGLTLLQIKSDLWFRIFVWFNIGLMCVYGFGNLFFILLQCRPLPAAWGDFEHAGPDPQCLPPMAITVASILGAVASILTDVLLSLAPLSFLWSLKRPLRERVVLGLLMSLGLFAGACSLLKNLEVRSLAEAAFLPPAELLATDFGAKAVYICIWTALEQLLGIVAACTPFCKPVFERYLGVVVDGLHLPLSIIKTKSSRRTATTSSFGEVTTYRPSKGYYDRAASAQDKPFGASRVTSPVGGVGGGSMMGGRGGGALSAEERLEDSDEVPFAIEMEPRVAAAWSKRQGGVVRRTDIRIDSGSVHSDDLDRIESIQWKLVRVRE